MSPLRLALSCGLLLNACHTAPKEQSVEDLDNDLTQNHSDPAIKGALADQIMVDPQLAQHANQYSIRPPDEPSAMPLPPVEHRLVPAGEAIAPLALRAQDLATRNLLPLSHCDLAVHYSAIFATKLPADLPIYPKGHVSEAAGSDTPQCHLRAVSYVAATSQQAVVDFYTSHGIAAGYRVSRTSDGLTGQRGRDNAQFQLSLSATNQDGTAVDLVSNAGH